jgi:hypothetical protein
MTAAARQITSSIAVHARSRGGLDSHCVLVDAGMLGLQTSDQPVA